MLFNSFLTSLLTKKTYLAGLHGNPMPETAITDAYLRYLIQAPEAYDTPSIHSQFTITHTSSTFPPLPPHHWVPSLLFIPHAHFPFLISTATSSHLANLTSSQLSVSSRPLSWCASIEELHHESPKTKVEADATAHPFLFFSIFFSFHYLWSLIRTPKEVDRKARF